MPILWCPVLRDLLANPVPWVLPDLRAIRVFPVRSAQPVLRARRVL